jgi:hypothetical protein
VQQAVAAREAAIAASIASRPAPIKRPVGRPKVLAPLGVQAPPGERHVWACGHPGDFRDHHGGGRGGGGNARVTPQTEVRSLKTRLRL